ncbi:MAG: aminodeoxychorismate/anthranilate synthase component II [Bacteroidetes bacterium]|nr:aminodeoxychorismate/anthranilate synthase component II [Bacteroidota bacterium]
MKVLIIDNHDSFTYNLVGIIEQTGLCEVVVIKNEKKNLKFIKGFDKYVFSPGPGIPSEEEGLMKHILGKFGTSKSVLGVCLGHQAIAEFYGAKIINLSKVFHGIKAEIKVTDSSEYLFSGLPKIIQVGLYHSWGVSSKEFPECLNVTAESEEGIIMALSHKTYDIKGLQFHPESIMTETGNAIITNWIKQ